MTQTIETIFVYNLQKKNTHTRFNKFKLPYLGMLPLFC